MRNERITIDPVCLMRIEKDHAHTTYDFEGRTYYFCSLLCRNRFEHEYDKSNFIMAMKEEELKM